MTESEQSIARAGAARRVLIVEDETLVGIGIKANLEKLGHTVVGQADDAAQALEMFQQHAPDLVLMDIRLDGAASKEDGIELSTKLLAIRRVPIIIISAYHCGRVRVSSQARDARIARSPDRRRAQAL